MDNGTRSLSNLISNTIPYIQNNRKYNFYIGIDSLTAKAKSQILKVKFTTITSLKGLYSYISKVDCIITEQVSIL